VTNVESLKQLADRFFAAIEAFDHEALDAIYTKDAVVWHNYDNVEQPRDANIAMLSKFPTMFKTFKYDNIRRGFFDGGFVQQHVVRGVKANGEPFAVPNCMVITVKGGQIARIDDYFDSAQDARPAQHR
jgi:ketosteroid isomerase-like protein